ncbi:MAG: rhomboid family intramembrane serine protease [Candidatus Levybacteria bacterium]|nr:rhomboid family intramembrane serine protease [Candidatus Levybacteria bacterium]
MIPISDSVPSIRFPFINVFLIIITVYVFYLELTSPTQELFISSYALIPSTINFQDYHTLFPFITAIFLHGGFLHIASNLLFLWVFGDNVEGYLGWFLYIVLYLVSGIAGNLVQYFIMPSSQIPILGASGAIAGVLGAYYLLFPHSRIKTFVPFFGFFYSMLEIPAGFMLAYWFVLQLVSATASLPGMAASEGGVAFWAHVGGFAAGVLIVKLLGKERIYA